jgi:hypothetical protein
MPMRTFKTEWFSKAARKARITDRELCSAIEKLTLGQADDLGGGVFKKRLRENQYRSIVVTKSEEFWVFVYLFAKKDRSNIDDNELNAFRKLAHVYRGKTARDLNAEIEAGALLEICHAD